MTCASGFLAEAAWLQRLPPPAREAVYSAAYVSRHRKGETVTRLGEPPRSWLGIADGLLKVSAVDAEGRAMTFAGAPRGSWIGEGALLRHEARRYDIVAMRDSCIVHVPAATFRWLLDTRLDFTRLVLAHLHQRLSQLIEMVEIDRVRDPVARVARMLATVFDPHLYPRVGNALPLSHADVAELVGLSRPRTSGALKTLAQAGLLTIEFGRIVVHDFGLLRDYVTSAPRCTSSSRSTDR